jgi:hypothetical protein
MPPTSATEEIIEKKSSSPVATSCLIIAMIAMLAAMAFQLIELGEYRKNPLPADIAKKRSVDITNFQKSVNDILAKTAAGGDAAVDTDKPGDETPPAKADDADAGKEKPDAKEPKADEKKADEAKPGDEKADAAGEGADAKPDAGDASAAEPPAGDSK